MMQKWQSLLILAGLVSIMSCTKQDVSNEKTLQTEVKGLFEKYHFNTEPASADTSAKVAPIEVASLAELEEQLKMLDNVRSSEAETNAFEQQFLTGFHKQYGDISGDTAKRNTHTPLYWDQANGKGFSYVRCMISSGEDNSGVRIMDVSNNVNWRLDHNNYSWVRTYDVAQNPWNVSGAIPGSANPATDNPAIFEIGSGSGAVACRREFLYRFRVKLTVPTFEWEPGYTVRAHAFFNVGPAIESYDHGTIVIN